MTDPTIDAITRAVEQGRVGDVPGARRALLELWSELGTDGDPLHRCTLAHFLADLYEDDVAQALIWDVRALDAVDAVGDQRVRDHDPRLTAAGLRPSLELGVADDLRRLGSFDAAAEHVAAARASAPALPDGAYGDLLRTLLEEIGDAVARRDTTPRP